MNATARFYTWFWIALIAIVAIAFFIGYRVGIAHAPRAAYAASVTVGDGSGLQEAAVGTSP